MILREVSREVPLVVVFTSMCLGIVVLLKDVHASVFCFLFLLMLIARGRIVHTGFGFLLALAAVFFSPGWSDVPDGEHRFEGTVAESGFLRGVYRVRLDHVSIGGKRVKGYALLSMYDHVSDLSKGSVIKGRARLRAPRAYGNSGEFDYRKHLLGQGITLNGYIREIERTTLKKTKGGAGFRHTIASRLSRYARPEAEVLKAVLTGDVSGIVYSLRDGFASLGIAHLMAISGLHMGIVFLFGHMGCFALLRILFPLAQRLDTPFIAKSAGLACVFFYTAFVGGSLPAVRSAIMAACVIISLMLTRKSHLLEALSTAGIIILLWMPHSLYSSSFLLSFSAVLGITGVYYRLENSPRWILYMAIPVVATAFTLPVTISHFGFVSRCGLLANIVFVPWFSFVIMPLGMAGLAFSPVSGYLSSVLLSLSFDALAVISKAADAFGRLYPVAFPGTVWVMVCYVGLIVAFFTHPPRPRTVMISLSVMLIIIIPPGLALYRSHQPLCFDFISVGQGDSVLVTKGRNAILIDAGGSRSGFDTGRFIVGPHLLKRGVTRLDLAVITHSHPDHIRGMPYILEYFPASEVWTNMKYDWNPDFQSVISITERKGIPVRNVCLGDVRSFPGLEVEVLNPRQRISCRKAGMDLNLHSIVLRIGDTDMRGLLMGDVGGLGEIRLCRLKKDLSAQVLKVGHHGSKNTCQMMFLKQVNPKVAVVQAGYQNIFSLPSRVSLDRLQEKGAVVCRTDLDGEVVVYAKDGLLQVKSRRVPADRSQED